MSPSSRNATQLTPKGTPSSPSLDTALQWSPSVIAHHQSQQAVGDTMQSPGSQWKSSRIYSIRIRPAFIGQTFDYVQRCLLLNEQCLPIALFRSPDRLRQGFFTAGAGGAVPYVFLCPPQDTVLRKGDRLFILATVDPNYYEKSPANKSSGNQPSPKDPSTLTSILRGR